MYGSEFDETSRRSKHYSWVSDLHRRSWTQTSKDEVGLSDITFQLLQLLTKLFTKQCGLAPPPTHHALQQFCQERFAGDGEGVSDSGDYLKLAVPEAQTLSIVYADTELLFKFLQMLNLLVSHAKPAKAKLYENFVLFLYNNCQDHSCFFEPIRRVLGASPARSNRLSKLFVSLITHTPSQTSQGLSRPHETAEFIRCGGGMMVLQSLIASSKQAQSSPADGTGSFSLHSINKLGQKDAPHKPLNDTTELVDFIPHCLLFRTSSKGTGKVAHSSLRSLSLFQHTYASNEQWVQLQVVFPYPVLVHNVIACVFAVESTSVVHGGPSKMLIESSAYGGSNSCIPVTPVFATDSLKIVNVAFHQPVLTQHMVVHFHRPLLSGSVAVSKMEILGTSFGANAQSVAPHLPSPTPLPAEHDQEHQG